MNIDQAAAEAASSLRHSVSEVEAGPLPRSAPRLPVYAVVGMVVAVVAVLVLFPHLPSRHAVSTTARPPQESDTTTPSNQVHVPDGRLETFATNSQFQAYLALSDGQPRFCVDIFDGAGPSCSPQGGQPPQSVFLGLSGYNRLHLYWGSVDTRVAKLEIDFGGGPRQQVPIFRANFPTPFNYYATLADRLGAQYLLAYDASGQLIEKGNLQPPPAGGTGRSSP